MSGVRLDQVIQTSLFEALRNYEIPKDTDSIVLSGTIPPGGKDFEVRFPYDRTGTLADIYISKAGSGRKRSINSFFKLLDFVGTVDVEASIYAQYTPTEILINIYVTNFDVSNYSLSSQTYNIQIEAFDAPFVS